MRKLLIYLGDYVDRGLYSREVLDVLVRERVPGFERPPARQSRSRVPGVSRRSTTNSAWLRYGGDATLYSYGVRLPADTPADRRLDLLGERLREAVPADHVEFLMGLPYTCEVGDYLFVHAGIDPDKPLEEQTPEDMLWIRDAFLEADCDFGEDRPWPFGYRASRRAR